jgi:motility quorum-sensing regulator / GCU-specific mRNA interferase toxin
MRRGQEMEKRKPTHDLDAIKRAFARPGDLVVTVKALQTAAELGCGVEEIIEIIRIIDAKNFFKSMTAYAEHTVWMDVYFVQSRFGELYIKFLKEGERFKLVSFKGAEQ